MHPRLTEIECEMICRLYTTAKFSLFQIGELFNRDHSTIRGVLIRYDVPRRTKGSNKKSKYVWNESYFDTIGPNQAYILGLLFADGCNSLARNSILLDLQARDKPILERISVELKTDRPLMFIARTQPQHSDKYRLTICSKKITNQLASLGMVPAKSLVLTYPTWLPDALHKEFMRGYVDGDGYIGSSNLDIVGTEQFCTRFAAIVREKLGVRGYLQKAKPKTSINTFRFRLCGRLQARKVCEWLYSGAELYIPRKYEAAMWMVNPPRLGLGDVSGRIRRQELEVKRFFSASEISGLARGRS